MKFPFVTSSKMLVCTCFGFTLPAVAQQTISTWNGGSAAGQWTTGSNWTPSGVPSGSNARARIDNGAAANADVVLSSDWTIGGIDVSSGDQLRLNSGITLTLNRGGGFSTMVDNDGTIAVGTGILKLSGSAAFEGFGAVTMAGGQITAVTPPSPGTVSYDVLHNRSDLKGFGTVQPAVENGELIQANVAGQTLSLLTVVDNVSGVLEAANGGTLSIGKSSDILNSGGMIRAGAGSTVTFGGAIRGGQLHNNGGTFKSVGGGVTRLDGTAIVGGKIQFLPDAAVAGVEGINQVYFEGAIANAGELAFEGSHPVESSRIGLNGPVQFQGGGSLKLMQGGAGTGGPAAIMKLNFDGEKLINGKAVPGSAAPVAADRHTIEGAGRIEVEVLNNRGGTLGNVLTAPGPLVLENTVTNLGTIQSAKELSFQGVNGFESFNKPEGFIKTTGGIFRLNAMVLKNEGTLLLQGGTTGTAASGSIDNSGVLEVSGNSALTFQSNFTSATPLKNGGSLRILDSSAIHLNAQFEQSPAGTLVMGLKSTNQFGRLNITGGGLSRLAGSLTVKLEDGFSPSAGTEFPVLTGLFTGRFTQSAVSIPNSSTSAVKIIYHEVEPSFPGAERYYDAVSLRVAPAQKVTAGITQTINALSGALHQFVASAGAVLSTNVPSGPWNSLGLQLSAAAGALIKVQLAAGASAEVDGDFHVQSGEAEVAGPPATAFRVQSMRLEPAATLYLKTNAASGSSVNFGSMSFGTPASSSTAGIGPFINNGTLITGALAKLPRVRSLLSTGGDEFESFRSTVRSAVQSVSPWPVDESLVIQAARIVALGGGNIIANGDGNLTLRAGAAFIVSDIYAYLREVRDGTNPDAVNRIAANIAFENARFNDPSALLPLVNSIVTVGGGNFDAVTLERAAGIVANGGGNLTAPLDILQAATIVAVGGGNIVALGGGNFTGVGLLLPKISASISPALSAATIVALGGGNLVGLSGSSFVAEGIGILAPRGALHPRNEVLNRLTVDGDYTQSKQGHMRLRLTATDRYDQVVVKGKATLDGSLAVSLADPDNISGPRFAPPNGSSFDVIIAPEFSITQGFQLMLPGLAAGQIWSHEFVDLGNGTAALRLKVSDASAAPEIAVERTGGPAIADDGVYNFGNVEPLSSGSVSFTVKNTGSAALTGISLSIDGANSSDFYVSIEPDTVIPGGGSTTFAVDFFPVSEGAKSAVLHIASNDSDENPYDITLSGTAGGPVTGLTFEAWAAEAGLTGADALPLAAPRGDGVANWLKYAFGMNPAAADHRIYDPINGTPGLPFSGVYDTGEMILLVVFQRRVGSGLVYTPKISESLTAGSWNPLTVEPIVVPAEAGWEEVSYRIPLDFSVDPRAFVRVEVTRQ